jgi:hypothetical protein
MSSYRISSQASWSSVPVSKVLGWAWNWNIGVVDDEGISVARSWNAGYLEPPSVYIGGGAAAAAARWRRRRRLLSRPDCRNRQRSPCMIRI